MHRLDLIQSRISWAFSFVLRILPWPPNEINFQNKLVLWTHVFHYKFKIKVSAYKDKMEIASSTFLRIYGLLYVNNI